MDIFEVLGSLNKISIFFFLVTVGVLGYELYVFYRERKLKTKPRIPKFSATKSVQPQQAGASLVSDAQKPIKKRKNLTVILAAVLVMVLGSALYFTIQQTETPQEPPPPVNTRATEDITPPIASGSAAPLFVTITTGPSQESTSSASSQALSQPTATPSASVAPTIGVGGNAAATVSPTIAVGGSKTTVTPSPVIIAKSSNTTTTPSPTSANQPTTETLPVAGFAYPQMMVLFLGAMTVFFSILF